MPQPPSNPAWRMPRWLVIVGSLAIALHLIAVVSAALAAPSGPWPSPPPEGEGMGMPPQFAVSVREAVGPAYLEPIKMTHSYHFPSNRPAQPAVYLEVHLKDDTGREIETVRIPDPKANLWVRYRQMLLARLLADDQVAQRGPEVIAAPNRKVPTVLIWESVSGNDRVGKLREVPQHLPGVPLESRVERPSDVSLLLAHSYVRYLCRTHGAASGELIRHIRLPIPPSVLFEDNIQAGNFDEIISNFGELPR